MKYDFDAIVDRSSISSGKWEGEQARLQDPGFIGMGANEMDFKTAPPIIDALVRRAEAGIFGYAYIRDSDFDSMIGFYKRRLRWELKREWLHHHQGIWKALRTVLEILTKPGDEVIFQPPVHQPLMRVLDTLGLVPVPNPMKKVGPQYVMDFEHLESCFTEKTRAVFVCNPSNPTATVWKEEDLRVLSDMCIARGVPLVSDDVYNSFTYPEHKYVAIASLSEEAAANTITLVSPSKAFNLSGLSYAVAIIRDPALGRRFDYMSNTLTSPSVMGLAAQDAAYSQCDEWLDQAIAYVMENQRSFRDFLKENMPRFVVTEAQGLYVAWVDCSHMGLGNQELDDFFEKRAHIGPRHGYAFGIGGEGHMRFNLACRRALLEEALNRFKEAYDSFCKERGI